jgi:hypothetical protein
VSTTDEFWIAHAGNWPACESSHCQLPAVVGDDHVFYRCATHGANELIFKADGKWYLDLPDEISWISIGD